MSDIRPDLEPFAWTDERCAELRRLWALNISGSVIARQLGTTKSAVVGKAHRLGLAGRPSPIRPRRQPTQHRRREVLEPARERQAAQGQLPAGRTVLAQRRLAGALPAPKTCQWIQRDDAPFADADKCGQASEPGKSYCEAHWRRAWRKTGVAEA